MDASDRNQSEALKIAREIGYHEGVARSLGNLAELQFVRADLPGSEHLAREALTMSEKVGAQYLIAMNCYRIARASVKQGKAAETLPCARRAVDIFTRLRSPSLEAARATLEECQRAVQGGQ